MTGTGVYQTWFSMMARCYKKENDNYKYYGGSGIFVCKKWHGFLNFYKDMGHRPNETSLDRINTNLGYYKKNCRWATKKQQMQNQKTNRILDFYGEKICLSELSRKVGIKRTTLRNRLDAGWQLDLAVSKKIRKSKRVY